MARYCGGIVNMTIKDINQLNLGYPPVTIQTQYSNQILDWAGTDSKEAYQKNIKNPRLKSYVKQWDGKLTYKCNEYGFRSNELREDQNSIVALGCSHTFGIGLSENETYIAQLAKMLNLNYYNLGVPAGASDTVFRVASYWIPIIKPRFIVMVAPEETRFEMRKNKNDFNVFGPNFEVTKAIHRDILETFIMNDENPRINQQKNLLAIENISNRYGAKFYWYDSSIMYKNGEKDLARDLQHSGPKRNNGVAQFFYRDIQ
jgi:hypothetical protein